MKGNITAAQLLQIWEQGRFKQPHQATLALLKAVYPEDSGVSIDKQTVGWRDRRLFDIREWFFGSRIDCTARCPACGERLELELDTRTLRLPEPDPTEEYDLQVGDQRLSFRLPTLADVSSALSRPNAKEELLLACIGGQKLAEVPNEIKDMSPKILDEVVRVMEQADPQIDIEVELTCPKCSESWYAPFDIVSYLWQELGTWANRVLREVHVIARAYGWSEHEILSLSSARRRAYAELTTRGLA